MRAGGPLPPETEELLPQPESNAPPQSTTRNIAFFK